MILTHGERMVWAAAFARPLIGYERDLGNFSPAERGHARATIAAEAVQQMRLAAEQPGALQEDIVQMLRAMMGEEG